ncbi:MFS transporter [Glycocaulis sp.]|uniref:MFS transporter n=1 Tax=Glycocaulis sp. TaxID=1969725 RepID=UPI003F6FDC56
MRQIIASAAALLLGFALLQMGNALQGTLLALRGQAEGFSALGIGAVMSGFFLGMGVGSFLAPAIIRQAGHLRAFSALASLASAAALAHLLFIDLPAWLVIRAFSGLCFAGMFMVVESWLNASVTSNQRGGLLAVYAATGLGAGALGQLQISLAAPEGFVLFAVVSIILSLALVPASLSKAQSPMEEISAGRLRPGLIFRASPFGALATLFTGMSVGCFFALAPVFAENRGLTTAQLGMFMALATGGAMLAQWPLGRLSDRVSRRGVAAGAASAAVLVLFAFALLPAGQPAITLGLGAALGAAVFPVQAIAAAQVNDRVERRDMVTAAGTLVMVLATGAALGPMVGGLAMDMAGAAGFIGVLMAFQLAIVVTGTARLLVRPARAGEVDRATMPVPLHPVAGPLELPDDGRAG